MVANNKDKQQTIKIFKFKRFKYVVKFKKSFEKVFLFKKLSEKNRKNRKRKARN
jgi:hypothetical protein